MTDIESPNPKGKGLKFYSKFQNRAVESWIYDDYIFSIGMVNGIRTELQHPHWRFFEIYDKKPRHNQKRLQMHTINRVFKKT